ncbi:MAG TPA: hypothetical protein VFC07_14350 [Verrucomicrobiae bacterium]|nr:hypothetical protein [Verrucomicrobiae bacterium]
MKRIRKLLAAGLSLMVLITQANHAAAQSANPTNAPATGPLAGLAQLAMSARGEDQLPAKLCSLLWPNSGNHKYAVRKYSMPTGREQRFFCLRTNNQDIVIVHAVETKPDEQTKKRKEWYYRTTAKGELILALSVLFEFEIDDQDNDILKKLTYQTYGEVSGDGKKPLAITDEVRAKFEVEKKYWLGLEKKIRKLAKAQKTQ